MDWGAIKEILQGSALILTFCWFIVKQAIEIGERRERDKKTITDVATLVAEVKAHTDSDNARFGAVATEQSAMRQAQTETNRLIKDVLSKL